MRLTVVAAKINLEFGGGGHWSLYYTCRGLREAGLDIDVYSLTPVSPATAEDMRVLGVRLAVLDAATDAERVEALAGVERDVILVYTPIDLAYRLKRRLPRTRVLAFFNVLTGFCTNPAAHRDGCWLTCSNWQQVWHARGGPRRKLGHLVRGRRRVRELAEGFRILDGCVFVSPPLRDAYRIYGLNPARCPVVPEGLDLDAMRAWADPRPQHDGTLPLLYVGMLLDYKGIGLLCDALLRLTRPWRLTVYGDGPERPRILALAAAFPGRVTYRGHVDNRTLFAELIGRPFVFVHPSLVFEAFGRTIAEAMALEIPVVVPDVGGPAWIVADGVTGLHYRHRDAADLARRLEWAAEHPAEMRTLAARGREAARAYDYLRVARLWLEALDRIAGAADA